MPTYEYECARCGEMDIFQSITEDALERCPVCRSRRFTRRISGGGGVIFRGSGFWETDYNRSADYQQKATSETTTADSSSGDGAKKSSAKDAKTTKPTGSGSKARSTSAAANGD
ncbi:MAG: FmdB family zinc ribbon protein [Planctomycetota bacterium]